MPSNHNISDDVDSSAASSSSSSIQTSAVSSSSSSSASETAKPTWQTMTVQQRMQSVMPFRCNYAKQEESCGAPGFPLDIDWSKVYAKAEAFVCSDLSVAYQHYLKTLIRGDAVTSLPDEALLSSWIRALVDLMITEAEEYLWTQEGENLPKAFDLFCYIRYAASTGAEGRRMLDKLYEIGLAQESSVISPLDWAVICDKLTEVNDFSVSTVTIRALHYAIAFGDEAAVVCLLKHRPTCLKEAFVLCPVEMAVTIGRASILARLLEAMPDFDVNAETIHIGYRPMEMAVMCAHTGVVGVLLAKGASLDFKVLEGTGLLSQAVLSADVEMVRLLLPKTDNNARKRAMTDAIVFDHAAMLQPFIEYGLVDAISDKDYQRSVLHLAASELSNNSLRLLLVHGAKITRDSTDATPLHLAIYQNERSDKKLSEAVNLLLEAGDAANALQQKPTSDAITYRQPFCDETVIYYVINQGYVKTLQCLLQHSAWLPHQYDFIKTASPKVIACLDVVIDALSTPQQAQLQLHRVGEQQGFLCDDTQRQAALLSAQTRRTSLKSDLIKALYTDTQQQAQKITALEWTCKRQNQRIDAQEALIQTQTQQIALQGQQIISLSRQQNQAKRQLEDISGGAETVLSPKSTCPPDRERAPRGYGVQLFPEADSRSASALLQTSNPSSSSSFSFANASAFRIDGSFPQSSDDEAPSQVFGSDDSSDGYLSDYHEDCVSSSP